ncbi:hypothetical protein ACFVS2_29520 [Brevibacillus sp. NPDC058079]|uniref:hypothetical protein n=1 Tax=Brevibacillus sp. NPDC058079 TaxID=3346330 RepID=UPI0036E6756C
MRLKVVDVEAFFIVGIEVDCYYDRDEFLQAPDSILCEINNVVDSHLYYEVWNSITEKKMIGRRVSIITHVPDGCVVVTIPTGPFAMIHKSQTNDEHDLFAMTNYEDIEKVEFRTLMLKDENATVVHMYRPVEYREDVLNIRNIPILSKEVSIQLRGQYIQTFFNVKGDCVREFFYKRYVKLDKGYLWGFIQGDRTTGLTASEAMDYLHDKEEVLFFWDSVSSIGRDFTRNKVFRLSTKRLLQSYTRFTFDLYIFDSTLTWTIIFHHEPDAEGYKCCLVTSP